MTAANLERIVRPGGYLSVGVPPRQPETQAKAVDEAKLTFGGPGQSVYTVNLSAYHELETKQVQKEVSRTVDEIRVKNPEDNNQYVDVESVRSIVLQGRDGKRTEQFMAAYRTGPNTEVRKKNITHKNPDTALPIG